MYNPYAENKGNCAENLTGRTFFALIMFRELHQIYLLANMLGLGSHRFKCTLSLMIPLYMSLVHSAVPPHVVETSEAYLLPLCKSILCGCLIVKR